MRYIQIIFIFLFSAGAVFAGDISQIIFSPESSQTAKPNEAALLTIQLQYAGDSHPTSCMQMFTNSSTGQFSSSSSNWNNVDKLTINSNWTNKNFYYKDSTVGTYTITVKIVSGVSCANFTDQEAQWTASHNIVISESGSTTITESTNQQQQTNQSNSSLLVEPQIFADAKEDKTVVAGADVKFFGQAFGLQKEPLEGARYLWIFGDGSTKEGQSVFHSYQYPGDYIAVLEVSSGEFSASDRALVKVLPNELKIIEANNDYVKLHNGSGLDLGISFWFLKSGSQSFKFPENTFIKSKSDLTISSSVSKIVSISQGQKTELLYPNGLVAHSYSADVKYTTESTTVVDSEESDSTIKHSVSNRGQEVAQVAQVGGIADTINLGKGKSSWNVKEWLMLIGGIIIISVAGLFFIRRQSPV